MARSNHKFSKRRKELARKEKKDKLAAHILDKLEEHSGSMKAGIFR